MKLTCPLDYSRKTPNRLGGGYTFPKASLWNFKICQFTFRNSWENKLSSRSKTKTQENFTLVFLYKTPINSTSFLIGPWDFHVPFLQYPWSGNSMYSTLVWIFSGIAHRWKCLVWNCNKNTVLFDQWAWIIRD